MLACVFICLCLADAPPAHAQLRGLHVVGVCSGEHAELVRSFGADETFDHTAGGAAALRDRYGANEATKFDLLFDVLGGELLEVAAEHLVKASGAVLHVRNAGLDDAALKRHEHAAKKKGAAGPAWHTILVQPNGEQLAHIGALFAQAKLRCHVAHVLPLEEVAKAHQIVESHHAGGKVVLKVT
jgi:NADPH:quinone reductase-like Zn-dependent oxidoreductase